MDGNLHKDTSCYWLKSLDTSSFNIKIKFLKQFMKKRDFKTLGTSVIYSLMSPPSLQLSVSFLKEINFIFPKFPFIFILDRKMCN